MQFRRTYGNGFTIVELLIIIVVLGVLGAIVLLSYNGIQTRVRNTAMISGVKQYTESIQAYHAVNGDYPKPPGGSPDSERAGCLGEGYSGGVCLIEDVLDPPEVTNKGWLDTALKQLNSNLPSLPVNVKWNSGSNPLQAGALYAYTEGIANGAPYDLLLSLYGIDSATAIVAYYLEGAVDELCQVPGSKSHEFIAGVDATDKDITVCVVPLGNVAYL